MGKCKAKAIQAYLGIFRHIQELFKHIEYCLTLCIFKTGIFRNLVYSKLYHIQKHIHI